MEGRICVVLLLDYNLEYFYDKSRRVESIEYLFGAMLRTEV
jgi:hypothetical protein